MENLINEEIIESVVENEVVKSNKSDLLTVAAVLGVAMTAGAFAWAKIIKPASKALRTKLSKKPNTEIETRTIDEHGKLYCEDSVE